MSTLNETPRSNRLHIALFGRRNAGKSSLINALTGQQTAIVSDQPGTTTDPVYKSMEIAGLGPCVWIDTAGFDDEGEVGLLRLEKTRQALEKTDLAILLLTGDLELEREWAELLKTRKTPWLAVLPKSDLADASTKLEKARAVFDDREVLAVSSRSGQGLAELKEALLRLVPEDWGGPGLLGDLIQTGETALLVMPQDIQAPKGRLILPQVQTIRALLDRRCLVMSTTADRLDQALAALASPPDLIITDSQVFSQVHAQKPETSRLTSFSILMAASKGDLSLLIQGARVLDSLNSTSRVLIAEACTHAPQSEDIGREKIPALLRKRFGEGITVHMVSGTDFPKELSGWDLVIHCGACMFNRKYMMARQRAAQEQGIPMTNYGLALAWFSGILDKVALPG